MVTVISITFNQFSLILEHIAIERLSRSRPAFLVYMYYKTPLNSCDIRGPLLSMPVIWGDRVSSTENQMRYISRT